MYLTLASWSGRGMNAACGGVCRPASRASVRTLWVVRHPLLMKKGRSLESESGLFFISGRGGEIRTPDPHNPIVVRYQAALRPDRITY